MHLLNFPNQPADAKETQFGVCSTLARGARNCLSNYVPFVVVVLLRSCRSSSFYNIYMRIV